MNTLKAVIEQAMKRTGSATPYALGVKMGTSRGKVSLWINGRRWPTEKEAAELSKLAGIQFGELIAIMEMEKAKTPEDRAFWKNFKQHGIAASLALLVFAAHTLSELTGRVCILCQIVKRRPQPRHAF